MERLKERYQGEKARLQQALESKDETIQTQQDQLERARRKVEAARHIPIAPYPIVVPGSVHRR
jgi:hypothetical protein